MACEEAARFEKGTEHCMLQGHKVRKYNLQTSEIPVLNFDDPEVSKLIAAQVGKTNSSCCLLLMRLTGYFSTSIIEKFYW